MRLSYAMHKTRLHFMILFELIYILYICLVLYLCVYAPLFSVRTAGPNKLKLWGNKKTPNKNIFFKKMHKRHFVKYCHMQCFVCREYWTICLIMGIISLDLNYTNSKKSSFCSSASTSIRGRVLLTILICVGDVSAASPWSCSSPFGGRSVSLDNNWL